MALSGSTDFTRDRNQIITRALRIIGAIEAGETPAAEEASDAAEALNAMVKAWQAEGAHLWKKAEGTLFLDKGQVQYSLGTVSGADDATLVSVKTELAADAASAATTISVDSITGFSSSDDVGGTGVKTIGIELDDGTIHFTSVSGTPSGATITLTAALASAASTDNHVYGYTKKINRPLRMTHVRRRDEADNDIPILTFSRQEYFDTPNKTAESKTTQVYYDPQLSLGVMYLWPAPDSAKDRLLFTGLFPIEDFDAATNNPDLPQEWLNALTFGLAEDLGVEYATPDALYNRIARKAAMYKDAVMNWDVEPESIYLQPDMTGSG